MIRSYGFFKDVPIGNTFLFHRQPDWLSFTFVGPFVKLSKRTYQDTNTQQIYRVGSIYAKVQLRSNEQ